MREIAYDVALNELGDFLRFRFFTFRGAVVSFLVQYETTINGERVPVVRYDSAHGRPHFDLLDHRGETIRKRWLPEHLSLNEALRLGEADLKENWERYRDTFHQQRRQSQRRRPR